MNKLFNGPGETTYEEEVTTYVSGGDSSTQSPDTSKD